MVGARFNDFTRRSNMCTHMLGDPSNYTLPGEMQYFEVSLAAKHGLITAALYSHLVEELSYNSMERINIDTAGFPWIDQTAEQLSRAMSYATPDEVSESLRKLVEAELIIWKPEPGTRPHAAWYSLPKDQWRSP